MRYLRNVFCLCLIAIVPFRYYANDGDSSRVRIDFGAGTGWLRNLGPELPSEYFDLDFDFRELKDFTSGHLRIGSYASVYAMLSFCEGVPIASQYGYFFLGGGGSIRQWHFAGGFSGGPYNGGGVYLGFSHDSKRHGRPSLSIRAGSSDGEFEGAVNVGRSWSVF